MCPRKGRTQLALSNVEGSAPRAQRAASKQGPLTVPVRHSRLLSMEVRFRPETESRLQELASKSGRPPSDLIEDAMAGYLQELAEVREMLDSRYDDLKK